MKLIALDLDGTTLNSKKELSEENLKAIKKAQHAGHIVMALSGRSPKSVQAMLEQYNLDCPFGASNGTILYADGKLIESISLEKIQVQKIAFELEKENMPYNMTTSKGTFAPKNWEERLETVLSSGVVPSEYFTNQHFKMFTTSPAVYGHSLFEDVGEMTKNEGASIQKFLIVAMDPKQKDRLREKLEMIEGITIASSSPFNLEVTHIDGHKGTGLAKMAQFFNVPLKDCVAIGDEKNDIPMFNVAGLSIAMENAEEEVKKHSHVVTLTNDENGVAFAFEKYILKE